MRKLHPLIWSLIALLLVAACAPTPVPPTAAQASPVPPTPVPATEPAATEPPPTELPATEPPPTELPATEPPPTELPVSEQPATAIPPTTAAATSVPPTEMPADQGNAAAGQAAWAQTTCGGCHGEEGEGARAPKLAGTTLQEQQFTDIVRNGKGRMPAFDASKISDEDLHDIYAWLKSLAE